MLNYSIEERQKLSYQELKKNRVNILNLKSPDYFERFLETLS
ncbi:MAG: hypothetical protein H6Q43_2900 [Deltaproteobacteria bacterium]|nr:hypothetical protein [Deltaproteobacteria bacterium]